MHTHQHVLFSTSLFLSLLLPPSRSIICDFSIDPNQSSIFRLSVLFGFHVFFFFFFFFDRIKNEKCEKRRLNGIPPIQSNRICVLKYIIFLVFFFLLFDLDRLKWKKQIVKMLFGYFIRLNQRRMNTNINWNYVAPLHSVWKNRKILR